MCLTLRDAAACDAPAVADVLAAAFRDGAVARWLDPDPQTRPTDSLSYLGTAVAGAFAAGVVRIAEQDGVLVGAALWVPLPADEPGPAGAAHVAEVTCLAEDLAAAVAPDVLARVRALEAEVARRHPIGDRHDYLTFLGVRPDRQGRGVGGALLADHHARLDAAGVPAYLEADDPRNRALYLRHGYADLGDPIVLEGRPLMWPMWRPPSQPPPPVRRLT